MTSVPLLIELPREVFDDWIADEFPRVQRQLREQPDRAVHVEVGSCEFVSPLPLLSLATELMTTSPVGRVIDVDLGAGGSGSSASNKARTRKYLSLHGFLSAFLARGDLRVRFQYDALADAGDDGRWFEGEAGLAELRSLVERTSVDLAYGDSVVLQATTWCLPQASSPSLSSEVRTQVGKLLRQADGALFRFKTEARKYRDTTLQRLTQVLLELVENAAEHAYLGTSSGFVGLYARVRSPQNASAVALRAREVSHSILLDHILATEGQHQVEVFVVDVGRGLFADIDRWKGVSHASLRRTPLRRTSQLLFSRPLSRHDRNDGVVRALRGSSTGLMHLDAILRHQHDRTRIVTGNEWLAGTHPRGSPLSHGGAQTGGYHLSSTRFAGTIFHVGISPAEIPKLASPWFASEDPSAELVRKRVLDAFAAQPPPTTLRSRVIDIRASEITGDLSTRVTESALADPSTIVRLARVADKNLLNAVLDSWAKAASVSEREASAIFLCDLGRYQAIDAAWVVTNFFRNRQLAWREGKRAAVFVVTEDLCCLRLDLQGEAVAGTASIRRLSVAPVPEDPVQLGPRIVAILRELRTCDSQLLWRRIGILSKDASAPTVVVRDVLWDRAGNTEVLPHYLDFSALTQDQEAARYIRRALRRVLALYPDATDFALDPLVEAPLHDAKKWLIRPRYELPTRVLVGSLSVSGSTLARHSKLPGTSIVGAVDCIRTPYYQPDVSRFPHIAALVWDPELPTKSANRAQYKRLAKSAFIEPIRPTQPLEFLEFDENLYGALESDAILKIGHWLYGDRHSLMEINTELVIEQSSTSESGAIPWLADRILGAGLSPAAVIAFPMHRLAYRLAHNVQARLRDKLGDLQRISLLPLSFLPRTAGGISRFAPLTIERARALRSSDDPVIHFLDVGFITNRTLRHSVRQLKAIGYNDIRPLGLLNRSSAPAFDAEREPPNKSAAVPVPNAFWRWAVPTMGTGTHCALCAALPTLARIRRSIDRAHPDLVPHLERVADAWRARDVADFWDEYGIRPLGLTPTQRGRLAAVRAPFDLSELATSTSTTLAARVLEYLRLKGDVMAPLRVAEALLAGDSEGGGDHVVELLLVVLVLTGGTLVPADRHDYVRLLLRASFSERSPPAETDRRARLFGLATLVFSVESTRCKLEVLPHLVTELQKCEIADPTLRLALVALTTDSDESTRVQDSFAELCSSAPADSALRRNFQALRPESASVGQTLANLTQALGRSSAHSQHSILGRLLAKASIPGVLPAQLLPYIEEIANLLGQCDARFVLDALGVDTRVLMHDMRRLQLRAGDAASESTLEGKIRETFDKLCNSLHGSLLRYGDRARFPLVHMLFRAPLRDSASLHGLALGKDVVLTQDARIARWPADIGDYLPILGHITRLFDEVMSNVSSKSMLAPPPDELRYDRLERTPARCWLWFDLDAEPPAHGVSVVFVNPIRSGVVARPYVAKGSDLHDLGVQVATKTFRSGERDYYETRVRLASLSTILESA